MLAKRDSVSNSEERISNRLDALLMRACGLVGEGDKGGGKTGAFCCEELAPEIGGALVMPLALPLPLEKGAEGGTG